ncbi:uncharacterized protein LOC142063224 [Phalacrocorax aristotelis]|uniref:uncharacterized protein LOC142063224 n=1 Tax=Phalacrocorax aristotelis TaxID=126867 RepID=UPI003F4BF3DB
MPNTPTDEEANAHSQPAKGLLSLRKRSQTDSLLPCNRVTWEETVPLPALSRPPRQAAAPGHAPAALPPAPAGTCRKLPPLPAAPSVSSAGGWEMAIGTAASSHRQLVPSARGACRDRHTAAWAESWRPAPHSPAADAAAVKDTARCLVGKVLGRHLTGSQPPSQQPAAWCDQAHGSRALVWPVRTGAVRAAVGSNAHADQPAPERHEPAGTSAAGRALAPPSPGSASGPGHRPRAAEHDPATAAARFRCYHLNGRALQVHPEALAEHLPSLTTKMEPLEELERSRLVQLRKTVMQRQQDGEPALYDTAQHTVTEVVGRAVVVIQGLGQQSEEQQALVSTAVGEVEAAAALPQNPPADAGTAHLAPAADDGAEAAAFPLAWESRHQEEAGALAEEQKWEGDSDKELSQGEDTIISHTGVNPRLTECLQDAHPGPQERPRSPSTVGTEAAGDPQSTSLAPATAAQADSQAPAPHSPTDSEPALYDTAQHTVTEVVGRAVVVIQGLGQQPEEQQALVSTAVGEVEAAAALPQSPPVDAGTAHLAPAADNGAEAAAFPLAWESRHQEEAGALAEEQKWEGDSDKELSQGENTTISNTWVNPRLTECLQGPHTGPQERPSSPSTVSTEAAQEAAGDPQSTSLALATAAQADSQAPAPHSPTDSEPALYDTAQHTVTEVVGRAVVVIQGLGQQPEEQQALAQSVDMAHHDGENMASPMSGVYQEDAGTDIVSAAVGEVEAAAALPQNPRADAGTAHLAPAADDGAEAAASPLASDSGHQVASEHRGNTQPSSASRDMPEDDAGIAALPQALASRRRPSLLRRALRALCSAFRFTCIVAQEEQHHHDASARRVPRHGSWP